MSDASGEAGRGGAEVSPDGTRVVTASWDQTARVWDAATGKPLTSPLAHQGQVVSAAFSPDGTRVVTARSDRTARVWDAATGKPVTSPLAHQAEVESAAFSPDSSRVVTASRDKTARVWDAVTGKPLTRPLAHQAEVVSTAFSPDGSRIVTPARCWERSNNGPRSPSGVRLSSTVAPQLGRQARACGRRMQRLVTANSPSRPPSGARCRPTTARPVSHSASSRGSATGQVLEITGWMGSSGWRDTPRCGSVHIPLTPYFKGPFGGFGDEFLFIPGRYVRATV